MYNDVYLMHIERAKWHVTPPQRMYNSLNGGIINDHWWF